MSATLSCVKNRMPDLLEQGHDKELAWVVYELPSGAMVEVRSEIHKLPVGPHEIYVSGDNLTDEDLQHLSVARARSRLDSEVASALPRWRPAGEVHSDIRRKEWALLAEAFAEASHEGSTATRELARALGLSKTQLGNTALRARRIGLLDWPGNKHPTSLTELGKDEVAWAHTARSVVATIETHLR